MLVKVTQFQLFFSYFFGTEPNLRKSKIACIGALQGVQVAVCGMRCIDLNNDTLKILGTHCSYNKRGKNIFKAIADIQRVLKNVKRETLH